MHTPVPEDNNETTIDLTVPPPPHAEDEENDEFEVNIEIKKED